MHILYVNQYFIPPSRPGGIRSYQFARYFVEHGHRVTMVTSAFDEQAAAESPFLRRSDVDGIQVVELRAGYSDTHKGTAIPYRGRMWAFADFMFASSLAVMGVERPDVVFATSTPLTIGLPAMLARKYHRVPMIFEVRDLWPEAPIQLGALRNPLAIRAARILERAIYRRSDHIIALSPGMRLGVINAGVAPERVAMIPNACDLELFSPERDGSSFRRRLATAGKFVCIYFGAMGEANGLWYVISAAKRLHDRQEERIVFVLCGSGRDRHDLETYCQEHQMRNVVFVDPLPKSEIPDLVASADVGLTIFKNVPILHTCSPNKMFDTLAAGRTVIVNTSGWLKELVERNQCGVATDPDDPEDLADNILALSQHPHLVQRYGRNARYVAERQFDRRTLSGQLLAILEQLVDKAKMRSGGPHFSNRGVGCEQ